MQIFICYSRVDKAFAAQLVEDLTKYEVTIWMDVRSIPHGANWDMEVQRGLDTSDLMLVLLSPDSANSQNVADEWSYFIEKDKPIVPVMIRETEVPFRLMRRQRVDITGDYETGFQQLLKAIGSPAPLDADATQPMRPVPKKPRPAKKTSAPADPEVRVRMLPMIWANHYNWFSGMRGGMEGDVMINAHELVLVPSSGPIQSIPLKHLISVKQKRSFDHFLKLSYYDSDGKFQSLVMMAAPKSHRKSINEEALTLLRKYTGRPLE